MANLGQSLRSLSQEMTQLSQQHFQPQPPEMSPV
jgi:hypothetical protein